MAGGDFTAVWNANGILTLTGDMDYVDATAFGDTHRTYLATGTRAMGQMVNPFKAWAKRRTKKQEAAHREAIRGLNEEITRIFTQELQQQLRAAGVIETVAPHQVLAQINVEMQRIERHEAEEKAEWLLDQHLNNEQRKTFAKHGYIEITGKDANTYRVDRAAMTSVWVKKPKGMEKRGDFCMYPSDQTMPWADKVLATKLYLEADEEGYLKEANFTGFDGFGFRKLLADGKFSKPTRNHYRGVYGQYQGIGDWITFGEDTYRGMLFNNTTTTED